MITSKYLKFNEFQKSGRKTLTVLVLSAASNDRLGIIEWYAGWRKYCFFPDADTVWSEDCMDDVKAKIRELMQARRRRRLKNWRDYWTR